MNTTPSLSDLFGLNLVEVYASWCPHCKKMIPVVNRVRNEGRTANFDVMRYDVDKNKWLEHDYNIEAVPTYFIYKDGKELDRFTGEKTEQELLDRIKKHI